MTTLETGVSRDQADVEAPFGGMRESGIGRVRSSCGAGDRVELRDLARRGVGAPI